MGAILKLLFTTTEGWEMLILISLSFFFWTAADKGWLAGRVYRRDVPILFLVTAVTIPIPQFYMFFGVIVWGAWIILRHGHHP
jgi:hypothetical protein